MTRRLSIALPLMFYFLALAALRLHLPTGHTPMLVIALLAGLAAVGIGAALVVHTRSTLVRLSSHG